MESHATLLTSPRKLQHESFDDELKKFVELQIKDVVDEHETKRINTLRAIFLELMKTKIAIKATSSLKKAKSPRTIPFSDKLKEIYLPIFENDPDNAWRAITTFFNNIKISEIKNNQFELKLFLLLRNKYESFFSTFSELSQTNNALDQTIDGIAKSQTLGDQHFSNLLLNIMNNGYLDKEEKISIEELRTLSPSILLLFQHGLLNKINFIRLLLVENQNTQEAQYYRLSLISTADTTNFIKILAQQGLLSQYNLEILFKLFHFISHHYSPEEAKKTVDILLEQLAAFDPMQDNFYIILTKTIPAFNDAFTREDLLRLGDDSTTLRNKIITRISTYCYNIFLDIATPNKGQRLLYLICNETQLPQNELQYLAAQTIDKATNFAKVLLTLRDEGLLTTQNFVALQYVNNSLPNVNDCFNLLNHYNLYDAAQQTLDEVMLIASEADVVHEVLLWLPPQFRTKENCLLIMENAAYMRNVYAAFRFECENSADDITDQEVFDIFISNLAVKNSAERLLHIYNLPAVIEAPNSDVLELLANKQYAETIAEKIDAKPPLSITEAIEFAQKRQVEWIAYLDKLNDCELVISKVGSYVFSANAAYIFSLNEAGELCEILYTNKVKTNFLSIYPSSEHLEALGKRFTTSIPVLTDDDLSFIEQHTNHDSTQHPHELHKLIPTEIINQLKQIPDFLKIERVSSLIQGYTPLLQANLLDEFAQVIEQYRAGNEQLSNGLVTLTVENILSYPLCALIQIHPDKAQIIATILSQLNSCDLLNMLTILRFKNKLLLSSTFLNDFAIDDDIHKIVDLIAYSPTDVIHPSSEFKAENDDESWDEEEESKSKSFPSGSTRTTMTDSSITSLKAALGDDTLDTSELEDDAEELDFSARPQPALHSTPEAVATNDEEKQEKQSLLTKTPDDMDVDFDLLKARCEVDYKTSGYLWGTFNRSNFLHKVSKGEINNIQDVKAFIKENPASRTSRIYWQMKMEKMQDSPVKSFLTSYFTEYKFSFFQRTQLLPKLVSDCSMDTINEHSQKNANTRTHSILIRPR